MRKLSALLLALLMVALLLTGCGEKDPAKDAATVVATVNGTDITKGEAQEVYGWLMNQTAALSAQYGIEVDPKDESMISAVKTNTLTMLTEGVALEQKLEELGNGLSDEDKAAIREETQQEYDDMVSYYATMYGGNAEEAKLVVDGMGSSLEALVYSNLRQAVEDRLREYATADVIATEEEVRAKYDTSVEAALETYAANPAQYVTDMLNDAFVYAQPAGYRYAKNLILPFPSEDLTLMTEKDSEYYSVKHQERQVQAELTASANLSAERTGELEGLMAGYQKEVIRIENEIEELKQEAYEKMRPEAEEILAKAQAEGADFDALLEEYGFDTAEGMVKTYGYPVNGETTAYVRAFVAGAMVLENPGDISGLVESDYGYHIIKYTGDVPEGPVPFEEIEAYVREKTLSGKQDEVLYAKLTEWTEAANIKTYPNRF